MTYNTKEMSQIIQQIHPTYRTLFSQISTTGESLRQQRISIRRTISEPSAKNEAYTQLDIQRTTAKQQMQAELYKEAVSVNSEGDGKHALALKVLFSEFYAKQEEGFGPIGIAVTIPSHPLDKGPRNYTLTHKYSILPVDIAIPNPDNPNESVYIRSNLGDLTPHFAQATGQEPSRSDTFDFLRDVGFQPTMETDATFLLRRLEEMRKVESNLHRKGKRGIDIIELEELRDELRKQIVRVWIDRRTKGIRDTNDIVTIGQVLIYIGSQRQRSKDYYEITVRGDTSDNGRFKVVQPNIAPSLGIYEKAKGSVWQLITNHAEFIDYMRQDNATQNKGKARTSDSQKIPFERDDQEILLERIHTVGQEFNNYFLAISTGEISGYDSLAQYFSLGKKYYCALRDSHTIPDTPDYDSPAAQYLRFQAAAAGNLSVQANICRHNKSIYDRKIAAVRRDKIKPEDVSGSTLWNDLYQECKQKKRW